MAGLLKYALSAQNSSSEALSKDLGNVSGEGSTPDLDFGNTRILEVPVGAAGLAVDFCGVTTVRFIYIQTNRELTFNLNGTESVVVKPLPGAAATLGHMLLSTDALTSLTVDNASGEAATVVLMVAGD